MTPVLYSFRRCPYAMRARLAILSAGLVVELREVVLRDKPAAFLEASPSGTVPCLVNAGAVIDESLDVMIWALEQNDPEGWLSMPESGYELIAEVDGPFKHALDRTKYADRYPGTDPEAHRKIAAGFLGRLDATIDQWIFKRPSLADFAILPFIRQFAFIDKDWFDAQAWPSLQAWLERFLTSAQFVQTMEKYPQWREGDDAILFGRSRPD